MSKHGIEFAPGNDTVLEAENYARSRDVVLRLQYMIAFLLEKNEQLRMQLLAQESEKQP